MNGSRGRCRCDLLALMILAGIMATPTVLSADIYAAQSVRDFQAPGPTPLVMPTAVAVDAGGHVFVADGVNDRILRFVPQGQVVEDIRAIGDQKLLRPIGIKLDQTGRLWIADTGNHRVIVRRPDGSLDRVIAPTIRSDRSERPLNVTDIAPSPDGNTFWLIDNGNHRLALLSTTGTVPAFVVGARGESLGRLQYPFMIARSKDGDVFVTDVINARVQAFTADGRPMASIGTYGVEVGQLYRPKGVAVDSQGLVWVSDSTLGVVQVFTAGGSPVGVLRDAQGKVFRFETPMGLAFDHQDRLYVVESRPGRVRQLQIARRSEPAPSPLATRPSQTGGVARACTVCHLEWMEQFQSGAGSALIERPPSTKGQPYASRSEVCFGCHDGSVSDSRRRVWLEHGHSTGVAPPASMTIAPLLPLVDGKLACRTCHTAHNTASLQIGSADIAGSVFLRMANETGQLCMTCHTDKTGGLAMGTHPVGGMPWPIPEELVAAGARQGPNPREITCQVCHTPHGARQDHLLVMGTESSQLCLTCHAQLRPGLWRPGAPREHPQNPPLATVSQREAIKAMGTRTGPGDTLICLSCHKLHHGLASTYLLADALTDSRLCLRCHPERSDMFGGPHDLRLAAPNERNRLGQTPAVSGPCGACHSFHQLARRPDPQPADTTGLCATCHESGQCAHKATGLPFSHPQKVPPDRLAAVGRLELYRGPEDTQANNIACLTCHNPHQMKVPHFLLSRSDSLCANCHGDHVASLEGEHDFSTHPQLKNARGRTAVEAGKCGFCHAVHNALGPAMWIATRPSPRDGDDLCLQCHRADGLAAKSAPELRHPSGPATRGKVQPSAGYWPRFDAQARQSKDGFLACGTCHEVHADSNADPAMLRAFAHAPSSRWCLLCHASVRPIAASSHAEAVLRKHLGPASGLSSLSFCGPCHAVHAKAGAAAAGMWAAPPGPAEYPQDMGRCLGCHGKGGPAPLVHVTIHPTVPMRNVVEIQSPAFLPLVSEKGELGAEGRITCETCHLPHGRPPSRGLPAVDPSNTTESESRALSSMLRPYVAPNLCSGCHGFEGLRNFLFYHFPQKRGP